MKPLKGRTSVIIAVKQWPDVQMVTKTTSVIFAEPL